MRHIDTAQRRARLARRHHLAERAEDLVTVAGDLCGLHSSDAASVMLGARARVRDFVPADAERLLYDDRDLARVLAMRRTLFVVPTDRVPVLHAATTRALVAAQRRRNVTLVADGGTLPEGTDVAAWLDDVADRTVAALEARGEATATELKDDVPELDERITVGRGRRWGGEIGVSTRVLFLLATEGRVVRGRPRGSWMSTQYRWAATSRWFGDRVSVDAEDTAAARARLAAWWLRAYGPATVDDLQWWAGWTKRDTRAALAAIGPVEVQLDAGAGIVARGDQAPVAQTAPWVALLPPLDTTTMGWTDRRFFLSDELRPALFDPNGNAGPTVWADGQVVGGWAQRPDGEVVVRLLADVGAEARAAIDAEAGRLATWLGDVRVTPRFRTPLEQELSA